MLEMETGLGSSEVSLWGTLSPSGSRSSQGKPQGVRLSLQGLTPLGFPCSIPHLRDDTPTCWTADRGRDQVSVLLSQEVQGGAGPENPHTQTAPKLCPGVEATLYHRPPPLPTAPAAYPWGMHSAPEKRGPCAADAF